MHRHAATLLELQHRDLDYRDELIRRSTLGDGYDPGMAKIHADNADALARIIDNLGGFPTTDLVGPEASAAAWLVVQHAIGSPDFMRRCRDLLATAVAAGTGDAVQLAYLTDRIAVFEGRPQRYGTQFDWDAAGELSPRGVIDVAAVDLRRGALGLPPLAEQTKIMRERAARDGERPPEDGAARRAAYEGWLREVGWR